MIEPAKPSAANPTAIVPVFSVSASLCVITSFPINPWIAAIAFGGVNISPRKNGERIKIQIGTVNSMANTCTSGITVMA